MRHPSERQPDRVIACDFGAIACSFVVAVDTEASAVAEVA